MKNFFLVGLCLCLIGCAHAPVVPIDPLAQPQYGMTKQQILDVMGKPDAIETYKKDESIKVEFYIYVRKYGASPYQIPVCLIDNKVVGC